MTASISFRQGFPVALDIEDDNRQIVQPQLSPGDQLERLVEGAQPPRQDDKGVGHLEHPPLAVVPAVSDDQIGELTVADLVANQEVRDHADHLAASRQDRIGNRSPSDRSIRRRTPHVPLGNQPAQVNGRSR